MEDMLFYDRMQFAFTIKFHYLFPQLTMGLSLLIVYFKWKYLRSKVEHYKKYGMGFLFSSIFLAGGLAATIASIYFVW